MKRALLFVVLAFAATAATLPTAAQAAPTATCTPAPSDCTGWHQAVNLTWTDSDPMGNPALCPTSYATESSDKNGSVVTCDDGASDGTGSVTVFIDRTAPTGVAGAPDRPPDHGGWYNHPLSVPFGGTDALSGISSCSAVPYSGPDGSGISVMGSCSDNAGNTSGAAPSATFKYDGTSPSVTGAAADRPPDHDGWYNHAVSFTFHGTDATSGIASCTSASYSGPVDSGASVNGACTDNAGNIGLGTQAFKYDDARPAAARVQVTPGKRRVDLSWTLPNDAHSVTVSRSLQSGGAAPVVVYSGSAGSFLDKGLKNGVKYRYAVTDEDQAGNSTTTVVRAIPTGSSLRPFVGTVVNSPPLLTWKAVKGARYYNVQLFFGRKKVLSTWPRTASLQLKQRWHFRGKAHTLAPGHYRWYVWPGFGPPSAHNYGKRIGRSSFRVVG